MSHGSFSVLGLPLLTKSRVVAVSLGFVRCVASAPGCHQDFRRAWLNDLTELSLLRPNVPILVTVRGNTFCCRERVQYLAVTAVYCTNTVKLLCMYNVLRTYVHTYAHVARAFHVRSRSSKH